MRVVVWSDRNPKGADGPSDHVPAHPVMGIKDALEATYRTDAHLVAYHVPGLDACYRVNKPGTWALGRLRSGLLVADIDAPDKADAEDWHDWFLDVVEDLPGHLSAGMGWYLTRGGARMLWELPELVGMPEHERLLSRLLTALGDTAIGPYVDHSCKDWTRCFRLPFVRRDGVDQRHTRDWSDLGATPIDPERLPDAQPTPTSVFDLVVDAMSGYELPGTITKNINNELTRFAGRLVTSGVRDPDEILAALVTAHNTRCPNHRLTDKARKELEHIARRSATKWIERAEPVEEVDPLDRPAIWVREGYLDRIVESAGAALAGADLGVYQRDGELVQLRRSRSGLSIKPLDVPHASTLLAQAADWLMPAKDPAGKRVDPPIRAVASLLSGHGWDVPPLEGVTEVPILRPGGSILTEPGYDVDSALWYDPGGVKFPQVPDKPTMDDARASLGRIADIVCDFPFRTPADRSVAISCVLAAVSRTAFGPCPLYLYDAHTPGTGKGLLAEVPVMIATSGALPTQAVVGNVELEKRITSYLLGGARFVCFDNVPLGHRLGGAALDAALTGSRWTGRRLGVSELVDLPQTILFLATGNNVEIKGDLTRRTLRCQLTTELERPEQRAGFKHGNEDGLRRHTRTNRARLVVDVLTIIRAYQAAGEPRQACKPLGSFGEWEQHARMPLVWLGEADPVGTQDSLRQDGDTDRLNWGTVVHGLYDAFRDRSFKAAEIIALQGQPDVRIALEELIPDGEITAQNIGYILRRWRERIVDNFRVISSASKTDKRGKSWRVERLR